MRADQAFEGQPEPPLEVAACRVLCEWRRTGQTRAGLPMFGCAGCGSQWVRSEPWTPIDANGDVPEPVAREAARR